MKKSFSKHFKNPVKKSTKIEGTVPREQLPSPPKGLDWYLRTFTRYKTIESHRKRKVKKYRYVDVPAKVRRYRYVDVPVKVRRYRYVIRDGKRKRSYYTKTVYARRRRYYTKTAYVRRRKYYTAVVPYVTTYKKKYVAKWWVLQKRIKPPKKEEWIPKDLYLKKRYGQLNIADIDIEEEQTPPFDWVEFNTRFNFYTRKLPETRLYDLIFLYYVVRISTYEVGKRSFRYVILSSSFDLENGYPFYQIIKKFIPMAIETTKGRITKSKKKVDFIGYVCFTAVTKRKLTTGRR